MNRQNTAGIRPFRASDLETVRRLIHHTIDVSYSPVYPPRAVEFFKDFHSEDQIMERHRKGEISVVEKDGKLIGTGSLVGNDVLGVFVHPACQHRGHGKVLMKELEKTAIAKGIDEVQLSVSLPSRRFYESLRYEIIEERKIDVGEGERLEFWEAKKRLVNEEE